MPQMKNINDYQNPFAAIEEFEKLISEYTGAPYVVTTDCCSHAIEMVFRAQPPTGTISFPCRTYLSVLMTMHKLGINYVLDDQDWRSEYQFQGTNVWDSARMFAPNMYKPGQTQCLSFGRTKPLEIGRGGCVLTDNQELAEKLNRMRYDGRDILKFNPWADQKIFEVGYHYYLRPEEAVIGINKFLGQQFLEQIDSFYNYPDCRTVTIV